MSTPIHDVQKGLSHIPGAVLGLSLALSAVGFLSREEATAVETKTEISFRPALVPIAITFDSLNQVAVSINHEIQTPIGTIAFAASRSWNDAPRLYLQLGNEQRQYQLSSGTRYRIQLPNDENGKSEFFEDEDGNYWVSIPNPSTTTPARWREYYSELANKRPTFDGKSASVEPKQRPQQPTVRPTTGPYRIQEEVHIPAVLDGSGRQLLPSRMMMVSSTGTSRETAAQNLQQSKQRIADAHAQELNTLANNALQRSVTKSRR